MRRTIAIALLSLAGCTTGVAGVSCNSDEDCLHASCVQHLCCIDCFGDGGPLSPGLDASRAASDASSAAPDASAPSGPDASAPCEEGAGCSLPGLGYGLCKQGVCAHCAGSSDDSACSAAYGSGSGYVCVSGDCARGSCSSDSECDPGQICGLAGPQLCSPCQSDDQCKADPGYGSGTLCAGGSCVAGDCHGSGECQHGQLCKDNTCAACASGKECRSDPTYGPGHVCASGSCVPGDCVSTASCPAGELCGIEPGKPNNCAGCTADGQCQADSHYGDGFICASGACVQGDCHSDADCLAAPGQICGVATPHTCGGCSADGDCLGDSTYGQGTICVGGGCIPGNCHSDAICKGGLCTESSCTACASDGDCTGDAFYGDGYVCSSQGACLLGSCSSDGDCGADQGQICDGYQCTQCQDDQDCTDDPGYGDGFLCAGGSCTQGDCHSDGECESGELCLLSNCQPCQDTSDCLGDSFYGASHVCFSGGCVSGDCLSSSDCLGGQVCDTRVTHLCLDCSGDAECQSDPFYSGTGAQTICVKGGCTPGNCHADSDCTPPGEICGRLTPNQCAPCAADADCKADASYPACLCLNGACLPGDCRTNADCAGGLCQSFSCAPCSATSDCTAKPGGYGDGYVCAAGQCVQGNCSSDANCDPGQICGVASAHQCGGCTSDSDCSDDPGYAAGFVCIGGLCKAGDCHSSASCDQAAPGQVCGGQVANYCGACAGSPQCQGDAYYAALFGQTVCAGGACLKGNCLTSADCQAGLLCLNNTCSACLNDTQCSADGLYKSGYLCVAGACVKGDCHTDAQCSGMICGLESPNTCDPCTSDAQCQNDPGYGSDRICATTGPKPGTCVPGSCTLLSNGKACEANPGDVCCGADETMDGTCVAGNCCTELDCLGSGVNDTCYNHVCTACPQATGASFYVDPAGGSDTAGTGSNKPGCAFKTITRALQAVGAPALASSVLVLPTGTVGASTGEKFPIYLPAQATLAGYPQATVMVPAHSTGVVIANAMSAVENLVLDGQSQTASSGLLVSSGSGMIQNLTVKNFFNGGIRVTGGSLTVGDGVTSTGNGTTAAKASGLQVSAGTVMINPNTATGSGVHFDLNTAHGIHVIDTGVVNLSGTPASSSTGSVTTNKNAIAGVYIQPSSIIGQTTGATTISGLVSSGNDTYGLRIFGGSGIALRNSQLLANGIDGVLVSTFAVGTTRSSDLSNIDFGSAGQPGGNTFQVGTGSDPNGGAGICLNIDSDAKQTLKAEGNIFSGPTHCVGSAGGTLKRNGTCTGGVDVSVSPSAQTTNSIDVATCQ